MSSNFSDLRFCGPEAHRPGTPGGRAENEHRGWWFAWTTERSAGAKPWAALVYKPVGDTMELVAERRFAQRQKAKAQAGRWLELAKAQATGRIPARVLASNRPSS